mmetsp:Transcript_16822/g.39027  ORF Transcript_16822/g.39027 Transcript_16822/m.39027 type:complete len:873 (+) Transcript_16822:113-2731(+)
MVGTKMVADMLNAAHMHESSMSTKLRHICLEYPYSQLEAATAGFDDSRRLGSGMAGTVYRGIMPDGSDVAIKVIDMATLGDDSLIAGFEEEICVLSKFRHPNLVVLMGWGREGARRFLIYEFLPGGDAFQRLQRCKEQRAPFTWQERLSVARDAASGLAHLHNVSPKAFHRDIKCANILLGDSCAKMADFGLSCTADARDLQCEFPSGTPGYTCPEYAKTARITESSEVHAFGMVLLELLLNQMPAGMVHGTLVYPIQSSVQPGTPGALQRCWNLADPTAGWPQGPAMELASLALRCIELEEARRPHFTEVCLFLRGLQEKHLQAPLQPGLSPKHIPQQVHNYPRADIFGMQPHAGGGFYPAGLQQAMATPAERYGWYAQQASHQQQALPQQHAQQHIHQHMQQHHAQPHPVQQQLPPHQQKTLGSFWAADNGVGGVFAHNTSPSPEVTPEESSMQHSPSKSAGQKRATAEGEAVHFGGPSCDPRWACPACDEVNRSERGRCHNCGKPRPEPSDIVPARSTEWLPGGEVVLEVLHAHGGPPLSQDVRFMPLPSAVDEDGRSSVQIGRHCQPGWFEALLVDPVHRNSVSRAAFEIEWGRQSEGKECHPTLTVVGNGLVAVDGAYKAKDQSAPVQVGTHLHFIFHVPGGDPITLLALQVQAVRQPACPDGFAAGIKNGCSTPRGARSTQMAQPLQPRLKKAESDLSPQDLELERAWRLECVYSAGISQHTFATLPLAARSVSFTLQKGAAPIVLGRLQTNIFASLLAEQRELLAFISRQHLQFDADSNAIRVSNLSQNITILGTNHRMQHGEIATLGVGDTISFAAHTEKIAGAKGIAIPGSDGVDVSVAPFLTFRLAPISLLGAPSAVAERLD